MAKIGLKYPVYAKCSEDEQGNITYSDGTNIGKAIKADVNINVSNVKQYADDEIVEESHEFVDGTITLETSDLSETNRSILLGHEIEKGSGDTSGEIVSKDTDVPIYVGFGFYARKQVGGKTFWRALWFPKMIFSEPNESMDTKGETITFGSDTITGLIRKDDDGVWKRETTFDKEADAIAWVKTKANMTGGN